MKKVLKFGATAAALAITCGGAVAAPVSLGSPQQNFGLVPAGPGFSDDHYASTTTTNSHLVAAKAHTLFGVQANNTNATLEYLHFYNGSAAPTCSATTNLELSITIPTSAITYFPINGGYFGEAFPLGIGYCLTTGGADGNTTTGTAGVYVDTIYK